MADVANLDMAKAWDGDEGSRWARTWQRHDQAVRGFYPRLVEAAAITSGEHVLDIGCGNGLTTRDAARAAAPGLVFGVDLSSQMLANARELARAEGIDNVRFEQMDAQVARFEPASFDVVISRFGAMFFADPVAAFTNIGAAIRSDGRLALLTWRRFEENDWQVQLFRALAVGRELPKSAMSVPGPFGLADPAYVEDVLSAAGYRDIDVTPVDDKLWVGVDVEDALSFVQTMGITKSLLEGLDPAGRATAIAQLRMTVEANATPDGVGFGAAAWLIRARK